MSTLTVRGLTLRRGPAFTLGPLDLDLDSGSCLGLVGANGSGKTSLMRCILAASAPDAGTVSWGGRAVVPNVPTAGVAGLIEEPRVFSHLDGADNLRAAFPTRRLSDTECEAALERVGLAAAGRKRAGKYSQGMRQRLGLARVLLADPELIVLDEPTNGLDPTGILWLRTLISQLCTEGRAVILSSHMLHEVHASATHYALLHDGAVLQAGGVAQVSDLRTLEDLYFRVVDKATT